MMMSNRINFKFFLDQGRSVGSLNAIYDDVDGLTYEIEKIAGELFNKEVINGKRILVKPNWVRHSLYPTDDICLRTHDSFTLATLRALLNYGPEKILLGDAPIQGCNWEKVVKKGFIDKIVKLSHEYSVPIEIKDFRKTVFDPVLNVRNAINTNENDYSVFDLGMKSRLDPITDPDVNKFRVTDYNPDRMSESHKKGVHKYCLLKDLFDYDVIISLPKIKTHQKTGITGALKNIVGFNGDKDYLPHHRVGSKENGGDCYPYENFFRAKAEDMIDFANKKRGTVLYKPLRSIASFSIKQKR